MPCSATSARGSHLRRSAAALAALLGVLAAGLAPPAAAQVENGAIAFSAKRAGARALFSRAPDGSALRHIETQGWADHPAFSPQGRRIAFAKYGPGGAQIWIAYLDGTGMRQLTSGSTSAMPDWSPTGERLVFVSGGRGSRNLYTVRADGVRLRRLTTSARDDETPTWSKRDQVAFVRRARGRSDIYVVSARGGRARRITRSRHPDSSPAWSPTGRTLVFTRGRAGRRDLYVTTADGRRTRRLTRVRGDESQASVSPDGSRVAFVHRRRGRQRVYIMKLRGRAVRRLPSRSWRVRRITSSRSASRKPDWQAAGFDPVLAAAGDIACDPAYPYYNNGAGQPGLCRQKLTSDLLLLPDLSGILIPGDLQYENGVLDAFRQSFDPTWGRLKPLIRPVPGNHEYGTPGAAGYFDYFNGPGRRSGQAGDRNAGYYSFDVGTWHVVALNSECDEIGGCGPDSPQGRWLRADLASRPSACTLAFFHGPRFTSGRYGDQSEDVRPFWDILHAYGTEIVVSGHEHFYERFAPQTPDGRYDPGAGVRQFTVGTGGRGRHGFITVAPNSEVRDNRTLGVLLLTLREERYEWKLVRAPTARVVDSGRASCH